VADADNKRAEPRTKPGIPANQGENRTGHLRIVRFLFNIAQ